MRKLLDMPKEGQFVAVWEHNGALWSNTLRWVEDQLKIYNSNREFWEITCSSDLMPNCTFYQFPACVDAHVGDEVIVVEDLHGGTLVGLTGVVVEMADSYYEVRIDGSKYLCTNVRPVEGRSKYEQKEGVIVEEEQKYTFNINTKLDINWEKIGEDCNSNNQVLLITTQNDTYIMVTDSLIDKLCKIRKLDDLLQKVDLFLSDDEFSVLLLQDKRDVGFVKDYLTDVRNSPWPEDYRDKGEVVVQLLDI